MGNEPELEKRSLHHAVRLHQQGHLVEAKGIYLQVLRVEPCNPDALHLLGVLAFQENRNDEAINLISRAIALQKRVPDYHNNLGNAYLAQNKPDEAVASYRKALELNPKYPDAYNNLGNALKDQGRLNEAISCYERSLRLDPNAAKVYKNLGLALNEAGRHKDAIISFHEAIRLQPGYADAHQGLGNALKRSGRLQEAVDCYNRVILLNPASAEAHFNLGNALQELNRLEEAAVCYRTALGRRSDYAAAHVNMGHVLFELGLRTEAISHYRQALELAPHYTLARWGLCISQLSIIYEDTEGIQRARASYLIELELLRQSLRLDTDVEINAASEAVGSRQPFFLAYQGLCDRNPHAIYGELVCRIQAAKYPCWGQPPPMPACKQSAPLRIGIVSGFFYRHSNWKIPIKGWVENLDKQRFALHGYYTGLKKDIETEAARRPFLRFVENEERFERLCDIIRKDRLHVLIFPEVGMDPVTLRLASLRLAPVQCTSWGHPDTSGLPTVDYYLSSDLMEPPGAESHYTERLVRLPNLSIYYEPLQIAPAMVDRAQLGLREKTAVFLCAQSSFKYLPRYDDVFPRIASIIGPCQFAFLGHARSTYITKQFQERLDRAFAAYGLRTADFVTFLPHLSSEHYEALNSLADVFLDSIGWSGCNSTLEAIAKNLPVVTLPGDLMRGRHSYAIFKMMGIEETIARDLDDYVAIAARLATDANWRRQISESISANKHRVYRDMACIEGLQSFLQQAVASRG